MGMWSNTVGSVSSARTSMGSDAEDVDEAAGPLGLDHETVEHASFATAEAYMAQQRQFLASLATEHPDESLLVWLEKEMTVYQEQAYLLDPYLDELVAGPAAYLHAHIKAMPTRWKELPLPARQSLSHVARLLYTYTKVRGYKVITRFLPHDVHDLQPLVRVLEASEAMPWELVYMILLWLSLVVLVPFAFPLHEGVSILDRVERISRSFLARPGKERDAASEVLGRLYQRHDAERPLVSPFLVWAETQLPTTRSVFLATGILQTLCKMAKWSHVSFVQTHHDAIVRLLAHATSWAGQNTLLDRYRMKLASRLALPLLAHDADDERVDGHMDTLLRGLSHADTRVRYSAAKGVARVSERVPLDMQSQVIEALLAKLTAFVPTSSVPAAVLAQSDVPTLNMAHVYTLRTVDLHAVSEPTWHGVHLALAECVRRSLIPTSWVSRMLYWVCTGLAFDVRRATGSTGSSVRDASCYVLWSLARSREIQRLATVTPAVAQCLVVTATLDRDVSIRRAASAAFQEWVGRTSLVPHGIHVLRLTDFRAVGSLRHAYLQCVASLAPYDVYRSALRHHLLHCALWHWDAQIRTLAASAVPPLLQAEPSYVASCMQILQQRASAPHGDSVHGALLACVAIVPLFPSLARDGAHIVAALPSTVLRTSGSALVLGAACRLWALCAEHVSPDDREAGDALLRTASARPEDDVQQSAAAAWHAWQSDAYAAHYMHRVLYAWPSLTTEEQQTAVRALGKWDAEADDRRALLCDLLTPASPRYAPSVDVRRHVASSLACGSLDSRVIEALLCGLHDTTTDQRGDVGSWVRSASAQALAALVHSNETIEPTMVERVCVAMSGMVMERIDTIRVDACHAMQLMTAHSAMPDRAVWHAVLTEPSQCREAEYAFSTLLPLLALDAYRASLLRTLTRTISTRSDRALSEAGRALVQWTLQASDASVGDVFHLLHKQAAMHARDNRIVVPTLQTIQVLLENDVHIHRPVDAILARTLTLCCAHVAQLKSVPRLLASMHICVSLVAHPTLQAEALRHARTFLVHRFPTVRVQTSEHLYLVLQENALGEDITNVEEYLLNTNWSTGPVTACTAAAEEIHAMLTTLAGHKDHSSNRNDIA